MNIKEAFDYLSQLTTEQREATTVCSVYYNPSQNSFFVIELLKNADEEDYDNLEDSDTNFYSAEYQAGIIGSSENEEGFCSAMTINEIIETHNNYSDHEVALDELNYQVFHDLEGISDKLIEYVLFQLFPELLKFDGNGERAVINNPTGLREEARKLVKDKFPLSL